jgi:MFS family permease
MDSALALLAGIAASAFSIDLWVNYRARPRPHIAAYGLGMTMFAVATWALYLGLALGWNGLVYRAFFLFGGVLNIPFLALGSMFLVVGRKSGHVMAIGLGALTAISATLTATVPFANALPASGVPHDIFATGFSPRLFAIIGGSLGATTLTVLSIVSAFRFWKRNRGIVWGNLLIVAGTFAAASGGTSLALGEASGFALSLLVAVTLIWAGYRVASGERSGPPPSATDVAHLDRSPDPHGL